MRDEISFAQWDHEASDAHLLLTSLPRSNCPMVDWAFDGEGRFTANNSLPRNEKINGLFMRVIYNLVRLQGNYIRTKWTAIVCLLFSHTHLHSVYE